MEPTALPPARGGRWFTLLAWAVCAASLVRLGLLVADQLAWPFDLEFESLQLRTVRVIEDGLNPYAPETYADLPFVFSVYTPLYHLLVAALPASPSQPFLAGRLVALVAMLGVGAACFLVDGRRTRPAAAALACGWLFLIWPIAGHTAHVRQESLALCASVAALLLLAHGGRYAAVAAAALCCLLALGAKQSYIAAALAGLLYLLLARRRREALVFGAVLVGLGGAGALAATWLWGRGFWFCTIAGTLDAVSGRLFLAMWRSMLIQPAFAGLLAFGAIVAVAVARRSGLAALRESPYPAFVLVTLLLLLLTLGKVGSHTLYFFEFITALLLWLAFEGSRRGLRPGAAAAVGLIAATLAAHEVATSSRHPIMLLWPDRSGAGTADYGADVRAALAQRGLLRPLVLNLGPLRAVGAITPDYCVNDALLYDRLFRTGKLSPEPLLAAIERRAFDVVLLDARQSVPPPADARDPMSRVVEAVGRNYRLGGRDLVLQFFVRPP